MLDKEVKLVVVACNTASAVAIPLLTEVLNVPVIGVIEPGARAAVEYSKHKKIGVIGTPATIRTSSYLKAIKNQSPDSQVLQQACPLFVPLVEEGWTEDETTYMIAKRYLHNLRENDIDTLILGCTHYPLLSTAIQKTLGPSVTLVDSGIETARSVREIMEQKKLLADPEQLAQHFFYLSDMPYKFQEIAERFLERSIPHVETINFEQFIIDKGNAFWKKYQEFLDRAY